MTACWALASGVTDAQSNGIMHSSHTDRLPELLQSRAVAHQAAPATVLPPGAVGEGCSEESEDEGRAEAEGRLRIVSCTRPPALAGGKREGRDDSLCPRPSVLLSAVEPVHIYLIICL